MSQKKISNQYISNQDISDTNSDNVNILDNINLHNTDVIILCGGLGKRLRSVIYDQPKVLAKIGDVTFLDILVNNISSHGLRNITLCVGHLKDHVKRHFCYNNNDDYNHNDYSVKFSEEEEPLGTGGALKNAIPSTRSETFIAMNGDSVCKVNFRDLINFHINKNALLSMVLVRSLTSNDYGTVVLDDSQRVISFNEKTSDDKESLINAGIYIMQKDILDHMPKSKAFSLEYDLFPKLCNDRFYGFITNGEVIDIGTPERYKKATDILTGHLTKHI